jgi:predicted metal-dependent HD superfamily phosphohydrolase
MKEIEDYCRLLLAGSRCEQLPFHNIKHTEEVVRNVKIISKELHYSDAEIELIQVAAWFHDTGFIRAYKGHEKVSVRLASEFLMKQGWEKTIVDRVCSCIEATAMLQQPKDCYEAVLCDADMYHISTPEFFYRKLLLRKEWELFCNIKVTDMEWHELNLKFLEEHQFKTVYGQEFLKKGQQENIHKVKHLIKFYDEQILSNKKRSCL